MSITEEHNYKHIMEYVEFRLISDIDAKKNRGEVFTPLNLINDMLDHLPKEVWSNPNLKWLDPSNGIGNFPICVYYRLMNGLKDLFADRKERSKHIIKNMLYMVELDSSNVAISKSIFLDGNISQQDFLKYKKPEGFPDKFDIIMGNPPFNMPKIGTQTGSRAKNSLWDKFVIHCLDKLILNGYLIFIHPAQWRGLGPDYHKIWDILSNKQLLYLRIYGKKDGKDIFKIGSRFDVYVLQNSDNTEPTEVVDELGELHYLKLKEWHFLPNYNYNVISKILTSEEKGIHVIQSYSKYFAYGKNLKMNKVKSKEHKYPIVHSITQKGVSCWYSNGEEKGIDVIHAYFYANTSKIISRTKIKDFKYPIVHGITLNGLSNLYTNDNTKGHFGVPKVILSFNEKQYSYPEQNDYDGKYGMSQICFGLPISTRQVGDDILKAVDTDVFKTIIKSTKWGAFQTDYRMFKYFRPDWYKIILQLENKLIN